MPIPDLPLFRHRDTVVTPADQNQFVTQFENTMDTMSNDVIPALNLSINDMNTQYNNIYNNLPFAPDSGYSQAYIDANIYKKTETYNKTEIDEITIINNFIDKPTPADTDNLALQETGGLLKKLSFANLKNWILSLFNPTLTANATLTAIDNKIVMNGIVTSLGLEIGDVIQFTSVADANNQKMRTVESIINDNEIIVNYEHCGNRGNGSLKLTDETLINATITRIAKWYNAPIGLGQGWVNVKSIRTVGTVYTPPYQRVTRVFICANFASSSGGFKFNHDGVVFNLTTSVEAISKTGVLTISAEIVNGDTYQLVNSPVGGVVISWLELR